MEVSNQEVLLQESVFELEPKVWRAKGGLASQVAHYPKQRVCAYGGK